MNIKKAFKPIGSFVKKIARFVLTQELLQTELQHKREIESLKELFRKHMQLLYSPTISILEHDPFLRHKEIITYEAKFIVPQDLNIPVPNAQMSVNRKLLERGNADVKLHIAKELVEKLFEDIKTRAKYISD